MKKRIIFVLIAVLAVSFSSTGYTAPKFLKKAKEKITKKEEKKKEEKKKEAVKPAATVNPLSGKWSFFSQNQFFEITFAADTAIFNVRNAETYKSEKVEMKYKFSNSPIILEHKTPDGKTVKLSMKYTVKGDKLTYRFLNMKNRPIPGLYEDFSMTRASRTAKPKDADIVVEKQGGSSEEISAVEEQKSEVIPDKPAETENPLLGPWNFRNRGTTGEITFTADKAVVSIDDGDGGDTFVMEMKYKFSKSPLIFEYKINNTAYKLTMDYKIEEGYLNYSFPNQNNKPIPGFPDAFSLCSDGTGEDGPITIVDCPTSAEKGSKQNHNESE